MVGAFQKHLEECARKRAPEAKGDFTTYRPVDRTVMVGNQRSFMSPHRIVATDFRYRIEQVECQVVTKRRRLYSRRFVGSSSAIPFTGWSQCHSSACGDVAEVHKASK